MKPFDLFRPDSRDSFLRGLTSLWKPGAVVGQSGEKLINCKLKNKYNTCFFPTRGYSAS